MYHNVAAPQIYISSQICRKYTTNNMSAALPRVTANQNRLPPPILIPSRPPRVAVTSQYDPFPEPSLIYSQGDVLAELAKMEDDPSRLNVYFEIARSKYAQSRHDSVTLNNWGFAYLENAIWQEDRDKMMYMLTCAQEKFDDAISVESDYFTSIANLGEVWV